MGLPAVGESVDIPAISRGADRRRVIKEAIGNGRKAVVRLLFCGSSMGHRDDVYWAQFLGILPANWMGSGILFRSHVGLRGYRGLWCFRRGARVVVSAPRAWLSRLQDLWGAWDEDRIFDVASVEESLGEDCDRCIGPSFQGCLDPACFHDVESPQVRVVVASDRAGIERFEEQCGADSWSVSGLSDVRALRYVYLDGTQVTAMAGFRDRIDNAGDISVLTHPRFRGEGRGAAVVGAVARDALASGHLVLYQTLESNRAAVKLALSLGFARYGNHLAVRLQHDAPRVRDAPA